MPISAACGCGKTFRAKDELSGKKVRCPNCNAVLTIPKPDAKPAPVVAPARSAEDEAMAVLMSDAPVREEKPIRRTAVDPSLPALSAAPPSESYGYSPAPEPTTRRSSSLPSSFTENKPATKPKKPAASKPGLYSTSDSRGFFADANWGGALAGLLTMLGGAAWLGVGLMANRIFPYAALLAILGFMGMVKSILGFSTDDD